MEQFYTIKNNIEAEIVEKKSKFIANLIKVESKEEAEEKIQEIKKKYYDARHNCVAYRVLEEGKVEEKASDDGEPSGTAGGPMLNILQKNNLSNVLIVVTRYFGGILLGTGGLVRAYSEALKKAIEESTLIMKVSGIEMKLIVDYNNFEKFKYYCKNNNISIISLEYLEKIECKIQMELEKKEKFTKDYENKELNISNLEILSKKIIDKSI